MKKLTFFILLISTIIQVQSNFSIFNTEKPMHDSLTLLKAQKLVEYADKIMTSPDNDSILHYKRLFFNSFPQSFTDLINIYSTKRFIDGIYKMDSSIDPNPGPNVEYAVLHISTIFNNINCIDYKKYINRLIDISIGGYWYWDAVSYFWSGLDDKLRNNPVSFLEELQNRTDEEIESFWFFYFDGPHPPDEIPEHLRFVKEYDQRVYILMMKGLLKVQEKWKDDH